LPQGWFPKNNTDDSGTLVLQHTQLLLQDDVAIDWSEAKDAELIGCSGDVSTAMKSPPAKAPETIVKVGPSRRPSAGGQKYNGNPPSEDCRSETVENIRLSPSKAPSSIALDGMTLNTSAKTENTLPVAQAVLNLFR
jgi:hypothetical protein